MAVFSIEEELLRNQLLEFIREQEHSDATLKTFRNRTPEKTFGSSRALALTIRAKTKIGAIIALADWTSEGNNYTYQSSLPWHYLVDYLERHNPPEDTSVKGCADHLVKLMFDGETDNGLIDVTDPHGPETITPFSNSLQKCAGKKD
jgi:hypothetical protein